MAEMLPVAFRLSTRRSAASSSAVRVEVELEALTARDILAPAPSLRAAGVTIMYTAT
jgi:hypothetical protein